MTHFSPGFSVQIAMNQSWVGTYRVVSVLDSNLVLERRSKIPKWPKCKTRVIHDMEAERFDSTIVDSGVNEDKSPLLLPPSGGGG